VVVKHGGKGLFIDKTIKKQYLFYGFHINFRRTIDSMLT